MRWQWALGEDNARSFFKRALELGINFFDTANVYSFGGTCARTEIRSSGVWNHFSRAPVASAVFKKEPTAGEVCALLDAAVDEAGRAPRYIVSDKGVQFQKEYRAWCDKHGVRPRFGALGKHGSIAVIERFWHSHEERVPAAGQRAALHRGDAVRDRRVHRLVPRASAARVARRRDSSRGPRRTASRRRAAAARGTGAGTARRQTATTGDSSARCSWSRHTRSGRSCLSSSFAKRPESAGVIVSSSLRVMDAGGMIHPVADPAWTSSRRVAS